MTYLTRLKRGRKYVSHIWIGDDTACHMWSTGGLKPGLENWSMTDVPLRRVCQMCQTHQEPR